MLSSAHSFSANASKLHFSVMTEGLAQVQSIAQTMLCEQCTRD